MNTTELDIKKACRLSKSAKRCSGCQKVAAGGPGSSQIIAPSPEVSSADTPSITPIVALTRTDELPSSVASISKTVQIMEDPRKSRSLTNETHSTCTMEGDLVACEIEETAEPEDEDELADGTVEGNKLGETGEVDTIVEKKEAEDDGEEVSVKVAGDKRLHEQQAVSVSTTTEQQKADEAPVQLGKPQTDSAQVTDQAKPAGKIANLTPAGAHHPHGHHHHHHHHHHHPHQHGHHHHHHHHRQCPHHKHHQQAAAQQAAAGDGQAEQTVDSKVATGEGTVPSMDKSSERTQPEGSQKAPKKKQSVGSSEQFIRAPSMHAANLEGVCARRKSECNRVYTVTTTEGVAPTPSSLEAGQLTVAESAACCSSSSTSLDQSQTAGQQHKPMNQRSVSNQSNLQQQQQPQLQGQLNQSSNRREQTRTGESSFINTSCSSSSSRSERKSSLNIMRSMDERPASAGIILSGREGLARKSSIQGQHGHQQHSQLKSTQSVCAPTGDSTRSSSELIGGLIAVGTGQQKQNMDDLERELEALKVRYDRRQGGVKMSKVTQSYLSYFKQWAEYDPFIAQPIPSNPWISDSTELWDSERQTKDVHCRRVRRWAFSLKELLNDPAGREQFHRFLEKEFSAENLK